jgi:hypothetical protein
MGWWNVLKCKHQTQTMGPLWHVFENALCISCLKWTPLTDFSEILIVLSETFSLMKPRHLICHDSDINKMKD